MDERRPPPGDRAPFDSYPGTKKMRANDVE